MPNQEAQGLFAEFHLHPVLQAAESHKEGREIYKDEVYIQIQIKGQKNQIFARKMVEADKTDFPTAWARWSLKDHNLSVGTPVTALPGVGPSMQLELKALGIHTVEDFAQLTDAGCMNIRGGYMFRERAKAYLAAAAVKPDPQQVKATVAEATPTSSDAPVDVETMSRDPDVIPVRTGKRKRA